MAGKWRIKKEYHGLADSFFFLGHETTANAMSFCFYNLAIHQDIQDKAREEALSILGDGPEDILPTMEHLRQISYIDMVLKEVVPLNNYSFFSHSLFIEPSPVPTCIRIVPSLLQRRHCVERPVYSQEHTHHHRTRRNAQQSSNMEEPWSLWSRTICTRRRKPNQFPRISLVSLLVKMFFFISFLW